MIFYQEQDWKNRKVYEEYVNAPLLLQRIIEEFYIESLALSVNPVCTRILQPVPGESGVHLDYRAADFRNEHEGKFLYDKAKVSAILESMNNKYPRCDGLKTCISHSFMGGPIHFHLQLPKELKGLWRKKFQENV